MTHDRDLDRVLDRWMDDGPTVVADRVIATAMTDVHTTRQRGARRALLKELFMTMKPTMTVLGIAAAAVVALAAFQILSGGGIGGPRTIAAEDLVDIVIAPGEQPSGMGHDSTYDDERILLRPIISVTGTAAIDPYLEQPGFVAGRYTEFSDDMTGLLSWAALFETPEDAQRSLALYVEEVQSDDGYGLDNQVEADLGDEGAFYDSSDPTNETLVILWRNGNAVLAAGTFGPFDPDVLRSLAQQMDAAAD
ncbi:MAG TPA: hypothetical protein VF365_01225 [Candidatus Limnocylindria bacterium]